MRAPFDSADSSGPSFGPAEQGTVQAEVTSMQTEPPSTGPMESYVLLMLLWDIVVGLDARTEG